MPGLNRSTTVDSFPVAGAPEPVFDAEAAIDTLQAEVDTFESQFSDVNPESAVLPTVAPFITGRMRLRDYWSARDFGMKWDGTNEDATFATAVEESRNEQKALHLPSGSTVVDTTILVEDDITNPPLIIGQGSSATTIIQASLSDPVFQFGGTSGTPVQVGELASPAVKGATSVTLVDASSIQVGMILMFEDLSQGIFGETTNDQGSVAGDMLRVRSVDTGTDVVELEGMLNWNLAAGTDVRELGALWNIQLGGFKIIDQTRFDALSSAARGILLTRYANAKIWDLATEEMDGPGVYYTFGLGSQIMGMHQRDMREEDTNGYGIVAGAAAFGGQVVGLRALGGRHAFTTATNTNDLPPQHWNIHGAVIQESFATALDTHPTAAYINFFNPVIANGKVGGSGIHFRGPYSHAFNPVVVGGDDGFAVHDGADNCGIHGGVLRNCLTGVRINDSENCFIGGGLRIEDPRTNGVLIDAQNAAWAGHMTKHDFDDFIVTGNPSDYAIKDLQGVPGVKMSSRVRVPDATNKFSGVGYTDPMTVLKTADEVRNNTASFTGAEDDHLFFYGQANSTYFFELILRIQAVSTTPDIQFQWALPAGGSPSRAWQTHQNFDTVGTGGALNALNTAELTSGLSAVVQGIRLTGWITVGTNAGLCTFRWTQNTATAEDITLLKGSTLRYAKV